MDYTDHPSYAEMIENMQVEEELMSCNMELEEQINHSTGHNHDENGYDEFCSICNS
jgi:hypothetical protein